MFKLKIGRGMPNRNLNLLRLAEKLWRRDALDRFDAAWKQLVSRGWFAVEGGGGWITGGLL